MRYSLGFECAGRNERGVVVRTDQGESSLRLESWRFGSGPPVNKPRLLCESFQQAHREMYKPRERPSGIQFASRSRNDRHPKYVADVRSLRK